MGKRVFYSLLYRGLGFFLLLLVFPFQELKAQAPDSVNYQAVARNDEGDVLGDEVLDVRMSIFQGGASGNLVYEEEHNGVNTDRLGLFTLYIGGGNQTGGSAASFSDIGWGTGSHHIQVEVDAGSGYENLGSRKLVSVPYALYSKESGGGGGSLQSAYEGGNEIAMDTSPVVMRNLNDTLFHLEGSTVAMGHRRNLQNTRLDVRHSSGVSNSDRGPGVLAVSSPLIPSNDVFTSNSEFTDVNTGVFGVGTGTRISIGMTGFTFHNGQTAGLQDSIYGLLGVAQDVEGAEATVGISGLSQAFSPDVVRSVGVFGQSDSPNNLDYNGSPLLAGGVFDANIDKFNSGPSVDSTFGVIGLGGFGGEHNFGVFGHGRGEGLKSYGVVGYSGQGDTAIGVLGVADPTTPGAYAGKFQYGRTLFEDTVQINATDPDSGEVLMAIDNIGTAVWGSVPSGGTPITLQDAYNNGNSISLNAGSFFEVSDNGGAVPYIHALDGNPALGVGNTQPNGSISGEDLSLHVANEGANPGHMLISAGDNSNSYDATLSFSERLDAAYGVEIRYDAILNQLLFGAELGNAEPMLGIKTGPSTNHGVLIGSNYLLSSTEPPQDGLLVQDTVAIGTSTPAYKHHIEGRTYSSKGFMTQDTAEYRYEAPKTRYHGLSGHEFRPTGNLAVSNQLFAVMDHGGAYFETTTDECEASAPLHLPDGAEVTEMQVYMYDNVSGDSIQFVFEAIPYGGSSTPVQITDVSTSGGGANSPLLSFASPEVIDNQNYMYRLRAIFSAGYGDQLRIENVRVEYEVDKAD